MSVCFFISWKSFIVLLADVLEQESVNFSTGVQPEIGWNVWVRHLLGAIWISIWGYQLLFFF